MIYKTLLARGYFPKELPPAFSTEEFSKYATTQKGRGVLEGYSPAEGFTEGVRYQLALPGYLVRQLQIPHPASFSGLARLTSRHFRRLLTKAGQSKFSKSRPVYTGTSQRAIRSLFKPSNLARERAASRAGGSYLLKLDISQFYPSLYTHAIGWAIDPALRHKANWQSKSLLGKKIDQCMMKLQRKISQGIPIGNDISYLLAEIVLSQVDRALKVPSDRAYRWFDDYEVSCDTREEAEDIQARLRAELGRFRLRANPLKSGITELPRPAQEEWQQVLLGASRSSLRRAEAMVAFFDTAFRQRETNPESPVLLYALGLLFSIACPDSQVASVVQSGVTQAILAEPGVAQKAYSLLTYWYLNGLKLDRRLLARTIDQVVLRHKAMGVTSDVSWALAFCVEQKLSLGREAARVLSECDDDCILIQALHCHAGGLLPKGFAKDKIADVLRQIDLDGEHWLLGYEALRQGFMSETATAVKANSLFAGLLSSSVTFYQSQLPPYASVVHQGGAPEWVVSSWLDSLSGRRVAVREEWSPDRMPMLRMIGESLARLPEASRSKDETIVSLLGALRLTEFPLGLEEEGYESYG